MSKIVLLVFGCGWLEVDVDSDAGHGYLRDAHGVNFKTEVVVPNAVIAFDFPLEMTPVEDQLGVNDSGTSWWRGFGKIKVHIRNSYG